MRIRSSFTSTIRYIPLLLSFGYCFAQTPSSDPKTEPPSTPILPEPTGRYQLGTAIFHLVDSTRIDFLAKSDTEFRELMIQVWYPSEERNALTRAPYISNFDMLQEMVENGYFFQNSSLIESWRDVKTNASLNAPLEQEMGHFPLVLFSHGLGVIRANYTSILQDLSSHGYIVAAIDHPYGGLTVLPDGRMLSTSADSAIFNDDPDTVASRVSMWAEDASFVIDQLLSPKSVAGRYAHRIDIGRIGMMGHSMGGAAALEACLEDDRLKACVDLAGAPFGKVVEKGLGKPTLIVESQPVYSDEELESKGRTREQWDQMGQEIRDMWRSVFSKERSVPAYFVLIKGTGHLSFSDAPFVMPDTITRFGGEIIDSTYGFEITMACIRRFFSYYLKDETSQPLERLSKDYPEVSLEVFGR